MVSDKESIMYEFALRLTKDESEPLFKQLYSYIKQEIISGNLVKNEKLPSKRRLASSLQCSQNTVQAAYNQLVDEGYLIPRAKSGYFVAELDCILNLHGELRTASADEEQSDTYTYDFSHHGVDFECFPFSIWRKITKEIIDEYDKDLLRTGDPQGNARLRSGIARYLHHSRGVTCSPRQIIVSSGTEYLLQLLIQLFDKDYVYAIENPGYEKLSMLFRISRAECRPVTVDENGMRPDELENSAANVACITPSHQFPTGSIMPVSRRIRLLNWAGARPNRYIIEDDYDSEFRYSGKPIPSLQGFDKSGKVIYIGAFSKSLSPALRISYMVLPEKLLEIYNEKLNFYICPVPTIEQKTLQRFMDEGHFERHLNRMRNLYRQKREKLVSAIQEMLPDAGIYGANAGLHFVLKTGSGMTESELIQKARERGVRVYGCSRYATEPVPEEYRDTIILGFATLKTDDISPAVSLLKDAWTVGQAGG
jgi:GntR family transcriptional regulator/MocR family aminotransferase